MAIVPRTGLPDQRGVNYAEIYLADDAHQDPDEVEQLRKALATRNTQELRIPASSTALRPAGHPDAHPSIVDREDDFWQGFLDRVDQRIPR